MDVEPAGKRGEAQGSPPEEPACELPDGQKLDHSMFLELQAAFEEELKSREMLCQELGVVKVANQTLASQLKDAESRNVELETQIKRLKEQIEGMKAASEEGKSGLSFPVDPPPIPCPEQLCLTNSPGWTWGAPKRTGSP
ncbi:PREDICTED: serine/threonine-protein kinase MRCK beta-like [Thamnophis sirtalis]|uniref:Serine/threonine-protein kinase MRCK beta-like n=1 Tax=Thamnophis sirtalis TaxID=35019 RepID=A0A6I9YZZ4_9SAUR|nr:PREDICTED: serine/threonine-protein kinase MRCK beta-like [Thamnophis sirtalis]